MWWATFLKGIAIFCGLIALAGFAAWLNKLIVQGARQWGSFFAAWAERQADIKIKQAESVKVVPRGEHGIGMLVSAEGKILNADTGTTYDRDFFVRSHNDHERRLTYLERIAGAAAQAKNPGDVIKHARDGVPQLLALPTYVSPEEVLMGQEPSINQMIIGKEITEDGKLQVLRKALFSMTHVIGAGETGTGKSALAEWFAWQIVKSKHPVYMILIDEGVNTFGGFARSSKLLYPIIEDGDIAITVMIEMMREVDRRLSLFADFKEQRVRTMHSYNEIARKQGLEVLTPIVLMIDEAPDLFEEYPSIMHPLLRIARHARKTGVECFAFGQAFNVDVLPSKIRNNFPTRLVGRVEAGIADSLLHDRRAVEINQPGEIWAKLCADPVLHHVQVPLLDDRHFQEIDRSGPINKSFPSGVVIEGHLSAVKHISDDMLAETWNALPGRKTYAAMCRRFDIPQGGNRYLKFVQRIKDMLHESIIQR